MNSTLIASMTSAPGGDKTPRGNDGVVELGLLLPTNRAAALMKLARERQESVGQLLRKLIERELSDRA